MTLDVSKYNGVVDVDKSASDLKIDKKDKKDLVTITSEYEYKILRIDHQLTGNITPEIRELLILKREARLKDYYIIGKTGKVF